MDGHPRRFSDRAAAGRDLAAALADRGLKDPLVLALPRGGIPLGVEIARALGAPLDLVLVRKIGMPGQEELALAAIVEGDPPEVVINDEVMRFVRGAEDYVAGQAEAKRGELAERRRNYLGDRPRVPVSGRTVVLVDDGLATGTSARAAIRALRRQGAARIVVAVPVAPTDTVAEMRREADEVICLHASRDFRGVGAFYGDFHQLSDEEAVSLLQEAWSDRAT
jgi:putative phosphoribosyl transferase